MRKVSHNAVLKFRPADHAEGPATDPRLSPQKDLRHDANQSHNMKLDAESLAAMKAMMKALKGRRSM